MEGVRKKEKEILSLLTIVCCCPLPGSLNVLYFQLSLKMGGDSGGRKNLVVKFVKVEWHTQEGSCQHLPTCCPPYSGECVG